MSKEKRKREMKKMTKRKRQGKCAKSILRPYAWWVRLVTAYLPIILHHFCTTCLPLISHCLVTTSLPIIPHHLRTTCFSLNSHRLVTTSLPIIPYHLGTTTTSAEVIRDDSERCSNNAIRIKWETSESSRNTSALLVSHLILIALLLLHLSQSSNY